MTSVSELALGGGQVIHNMHPQFSLYTMTQSNARKSDQQHFSAVHLSSCVHLYTPFHSVETGWTALVHMQSCIRILDGNENAAY